MTAFLDQARAILRANDRGGYTVPTDRLYPFQWNWDSAFVALGWASFDLDRAWREIERLLEGQWDDGMIPHIVFHAPSDDYFPGPEVWGTSHRPPTSGITQPPVLATAVRGLAGAAGSEDRLREIYPRLLAWHRWWAAARDPEARGLVAILHPWESGRDNNPDGPLARVPATPTTAVVRRDLGHVGADMRPRDEDYRRYIMLVDLFRSLGWQPAAQWRETPFKVADIGTNAILHRAEQDLLALAQRFGSAAEGAEIAARLERQRRAIAGLWSEEDGLFQSWDLIGDRRIATRTSAGLLPLYGGLAAAGQVARMAETVEDWAAAVRYLVPSLAPSSPDFEPRRYWRGPVWAIVNYMIADGFARQGVPTLAERIRADTAALLQAAGFAEYFDPLTGEGIGGDSFSWTAAMALCWTGDPAV